MDKSFRRFVITVLIAASFALGIVCAPFLVQMSSAQSQSTSQTGPLRPVTHQQLTVTNAAAQALLQSTVIEASTGMHTQHCIVTNDGADTARYWLDGTAPTTTAGHAFVAGGRIDLNSPGEIDGFKVIDSAGASAVLEITCER